VDIGVGVNEGEIILYLNGGLVRRLWRAALRVCFHACVSGFPTPGVTVLPIPDPLVADS
jgi:hypothetical protein